MFRKKIFTYLLLFFLICSNFQVGAIYASNILKLREEKTKNIDSLDRAKKTIDNVINKLDSKIKNKEILERLEEKKEEIKEVIKDTKEKIEKEKSEKSIKKLVSETKKKAVLKVISAVTKYNNIEDNINSSVAKTKKEKKEAKETIQKSLEIGDYYTIILKTKYSKEDILKRYKVFDKDLKVKFLYKDNGESYYELLTLEDSIFRKEMLEKIESGDLPEEFLGIKVVKPEVFTINDDLFYNTGSTVNLSGENLDLTRGVNMFNIEAYLSKLDTVSKRIKIGLIDTGIDYNHPDLRGKISLGYDFVNNDNDAWDDQGHGTHVAGIIGANINNQGIVGVNPYIEIVPLKICNANGFCPSYAVVRAISYAKENSVDILNMSIGGLGDSESNPICDGVTSAVNDGIIVVSAAGNSNTDTMNFVPGGCEGTVTVGAIDSNLERAYFSNYGDKVDVAAPGVEVYSTAPNLGYKKLTGTSMAAPHITGFISVMKSLKTDLTLQDIRKLFIENSVEVSTDTNKPIGGFPDVAAIIDILENGELGEIIEEEVFLEDDSEIVEGLEILKTSTGIEDTSSDFNLEDLVLEPLEISSVSVDFLNTTSGGVDISSIDSTGNLIETLDIETIEETEKNTIYYEDVQYFDENGNLLENGLEINNLDYDLEEKEVLYFSGAGLPTIEDTSLSLSGTIVNNEELEELEKEEIFIDGADTSLGVTTLSVEEEQDIILEEYSSGIIDEEIIEDIIVGEQIETGSGEENDELLLIEEVVENPNSFSSVFINDIGSDEIGTIVKSCNIIEGELCTFPLRMADKYKYLVEDPEIINYHKNKRRFYIRGKKPGTTTLEARKGGITYRVNINIRKRADIIKKEIYERKKIRIKGLPNHRRLTYSVSASNKVILRTNRQGLNITGVESGDVEIYIKDNGEHIYTITKIAPKFQNITKSLGLVVS